MMNMKHDTSIEEGIIEVIHANFLGWVNAQPWNGLPSPHWNDVWFWNITL